MAHVSILNSIIVRENQKDVKPAGEMSTDFKDNTVEDYSGVMRLSVAKGASKKIDVSAFGSKMLLSIKLIQGTSFSLALRKGATESSILQVGRYFSCELLNADQLTIKNPDGPAEIVVQLLTVAIKES